MNLSGEYGGCYDENELYSCMKFSKNIKNLQLVKLSIHLAIILPICLNIKIFISISQNFSFIKY